jgi:hypothetical protein
MVTTGPRRVVLPSSFLLMLCLTGGSPTEAGAVRQLSAAPSLSIRAATPDQELTDTARLLGGLAPSQAGHLATVAARPEWLTWRREFDRQWTTATTDRFTNIVEWRSRELSRVVGSCSTLMYPFSGPDILNAWLLFPDCEHYVLFGLEQPGSLPTLGGLPADRLARLLEETRHALNNLLQRNYFITRDMLEDTAADELKGTLPLMAVFLVRLNAQLISIRDMEVDEDGQLRPRRQAPTEHQAARAVEVVFARPGHAPQTLVYVRAQAEDEALDSRPGVRAFLERHAPFITFLKSASYLLHTSSFTRMRTLLLNRSRLILEDDSGIPLRFLKSPEWSVTLYGKYAKPVRDFKYGFQPDLERAFASDPNVKPLPFSFGYHWADGASSVLLAVHVATPSAGQPAGGRGNGTGRVFGLHDRR